MELFRKATNTRRELQQWSSTHGVSHCYSSKRTIEDVTLSTSICVCYVQHRQHIQELAMGIAYDDHWKALWSELQEHEWSQLVNMVRCAEANTPLGHSAWRNRILVTIVMLDAVVQIVQSLVNMCSMLSTAARQGATGHVLQARTQKDQRRCSQSGVSNDGVGIRTSRTVLSLSNTTPTRARILAADSSERTSCSTHTSMSTALHVRMRLLQASVRACPGLTIVVMNTSRALCSSIAILRRLWNF